MSGKGAGKKRNRAAQSEPHGYQEQPEDRAGKPAAGKVRGATERASSEKQRVLDKLRDLQRREHDKMRGSKKKDAGR